MIREQHPSSEPPPLHFFDRRRNVRRVLRVLYAACVVVLIAQLLLANAADHETEHWLQGWFGFYAVFGFVACVALVLLAKQLRRLVMREERYYEE